MRLIHNWGTVAGMFLRYVAHRAGLVSMPPPERYYPEATEVVLGYLGLHGKVRVVHPERCPGKGATIFAANHARLYDPLALFHVVEQITEPKRYIKSVMRDDFFQGTILKTQLFDFDRFLAWLGAFPINRDNPRLSQLRKPIHHLQNGGAILIYPGRTRSRSGILFEYGERFDEPGGVSLFASNARRRLPEPVNVVPVFLNTNVVTREVIAVFGDTMYLPDNADRDAQREFDFELVFAISNLVEVTVAHITAALLFLHAVHGRNPVIGAGALADAVATVLKDTSHPIIDPSARTQPDEEIDTALDFFQEGQFIRRESTAIHLETATILANPELTPKYREENPIRYLTNQIAHLETLVPHLEALRLR